jgi:Skp family chaperone for outer membrane proteins
MASILAVLLVAPVWAGKIGFLDAERAVATVAEGRVQLQALEEWAIPRRQEVERLQQQVTELTRELATQRGVAAQETVRQLENELLQARRTFEDAGRSFNRDLEAKQNELLGEVARKIGTVASEYGKANDFDAIFLYNAQPLAYIADAANVTDIVIRLYDERYPVN